MPKSTRSKLVAKADKVFSEYIRTRNADERGYVPCFTCGKVDHWKSQAPVASNQTSWTRSDAASDLRKQPANARAT